MMFHNTSDDNSHSILPLMHIHIHFVQYGEGEVQKRMVVMVAVVGV